MRAQRQEVLAGNIANADTPNYKARDFDFAQTLKAAVAGRIGGQTSGQISSGLPMTTTAPGHLPGNVQAGTPRLLYRSPEAGATQPRSAPLELTFDQPMDRASVGIALLDEGLDGGLGPFNVIFLSSRARHASHCGAGTPDGCGAEPPSAEKRTEDAFFALFDRIPRP